MTSELLTRLPSRPERREDYVVEIDAQISEALIVWTDGNTEEWAYLSNMKRWIDVE